MSFFVGYVTFRTDVGRGKTISFPADGDRHKARVKLNGRPAAAFSWSNIMQMTGNTIFITGATSGIGRGLAEAFHKLGNQVIIAGRRQALLDEVTAANPGMAGIRMDITDPASITATAATLVRDYPALNVLVNNAGIMPFDDAAMVVDDAVSQAILTTNLLGPIRMTSALIEHLKRQARATVINNTSVLAYVPLAFTAVYSASKAALHSYTLSQRFMLRETSVRVQEIAPPWVNTDLIKKSDDPRAMPLDAFIDQTMAGLATEVEEVVVDAARDFRNNPGPGEHALVNGFNAMLAANPIPV
ncbi:SDR family oxidoreductase [Nitrospirillum amazonense]|nr:SDR family NAD(P)-dependent oxidoreductase [Nitrospirillum amazonense]